MQSWYQPHPYGVYPRGNATSAREISGRFGSFSRIVTDARTDDDKEHTEQPYLDLMQHMMSFMEVPDICRLSRVCTGWYVMTHCTDAFKSAYTTMSPQYLRFRGSWKQSAIECYRSGQSSDRTSEPTGQRSCTTNGCGGSDLVGATRKRARSNRSDTRQKTESSGKAGTFGSSDIVGAVHIPVKVGRAYYCDQLFQAWMCTILPTHYHLHLQSPVTPTNPVPQYTSSLKPVDRCVGLSADEFRARYEQKNLPVVLAGMASEWPLFKILNGKLLNLRFKKDELVRSSTNAAAPLRCEHTNMSLEDYTHYATEQRDERPIYMFDAEFGKVLDVERLYTVPPHFARDDFFSALGEQRPKYRWIIAGPARGGSSFHVDPNYTSAWNANLTGRKRWIFFPPGCAPPGVVPSADMSEVATPVSLTEWLLNNYDASVDQLSHAGYECICEPGDIMFVPSGWWHYVINLEDSVAITQNYVSECNLPGVLKFLRAMRGSISGINEDVDDASEEGIAKRQYGFASEFRAAMTRAHPALMKSMEEKLEQEHSEREKRRMRQIAMLDSGSEGFKFEF